MYATPYSPRCSQTPFESGISPRHNPHNDYDHRRDCVPESEDIKKELELKLMNKMKQQIEDLQRDNFDLRHKVNDLNEVVKAKNKLIDEHKCQSNKYEISMKEQTQKITSLQKEKSDNLANFQKQLADKVDINIMQRTRINALTESGKKYESTIKLLTTEKNNLKETNIENKTEIDEMSKEIEDLIEKMTEREAKVDTYKAKYESCRSHNFKVRKELKELKDKTDIEELKKIKEDKKRLTKDVQSLKQQRKYFEQHYNYHKQKVMATSFTAIKTHGIYGNALRRNHAKDKNIKKVLLQKFREKFIEQINGLGEEMDRSMTENLAQTVQHVGEDMDEVHKKQRLMEERTADGMVKCFCEKTFASTGDLKHHMTVTHKMNTTDLSKNEPVIIQID